MHVSTALEILSYGEGFLHTLKDVSSSEDDSEPRNSLWEETDGTYFFLSPATY